MGRRPGLGGRPVLIVDRGRPGGGRVVVDWFPGVCGVVAGMPLEAAVSCQANAVVLDADEPYYREVFGRVIASLREVSDRVEEAGLGVAYVRVDGLEGVFGGEGGVVAALLGAVPGYLGPRVGVAGAKFPAFVAARACGPHGAFRVPGDVRGFLAPCPVDVLPVPSGVRAGLRRLGLGTLGAVASMAGHMLADRFGPDGRRAWLLCNGIDESPVVPSPFEEPVVERAVLPSQPSTLGALSVTVDALLERAYARPDMRGRCAGTASLLCAARGWPPWEKSVRFKQPIGAWESASFPVRSRLEADPPRIPVEDATLALSDLTGQDGEQLGLFPDARRDRRLAGLVGVAGRLRARAGGEHVLYRLVSAAPWHPVPELRAVQVPVDPSGCDAVRPVCLPVRVAVREGPDRQPACVRLGREWHQVACIEERWCFDLWWLPEPVARVYYRVSCGDGRRVTLFRDERGGCWYRQRV